MKKTGNGIHNKNATNNGEEKTIGVEKDSRTNKRRLSKESTRGRGVYLR